MTADGTFACGRGRIARMVEFNAASNTARRFSTQRVVLFDFDGVIVRGDAFTKFMRERYTRAWWRVVVVLLLLPFVALLAMTPRGRRWLLRAAVIWAFVGVRTQHYHELATAFGHALARDARNIFGPACMTLKRHRLDGDRVVVVTGCEETLARAVLDELGFENIDLVASRFAEGRFGLRVAVHNIRFEKAHQLALRGIRPPWDVVYSDSLRDLPILAAARSAVLVNPDRITLARVSARVGRRLSVVEWS